MACAAAFGAECVLSPEIGLAIPAAFLHTNDARMTMLLGPRLLPLEGEPEKKHVRVAPPNGDGLTDTKTFVFNSTIRVEYLDGASRSMQTKELKGPEAYCVQLLRLAFEPACWEKLD